MNQRMHATPPQIKLSAASRWRRGRHPALMITTFAFRVNYGRADDSCRPPRHAHPLGGGTPHVSLLFPSPFFPSPDLFTRPTQPLRQPLPFL